MKIVFMNLDGKFVIKEFEGTIKEYEFLESFTNFYPIRRRKLDLK